MPEFVNHYGEYDPVKQQMVVTSSRQSLVTSIINVGEFVGALCAFWIGQKLGMRGGLLLACVVVVIGTTLQVADTALGLLITGRLVLGK
jgi:MFS family permease